MGSNTVLFSGIAGMAVQTVSFDFDPRCVEKDYLPTLENKQNNVLPLLMNFTNSSPKINWGNQKTMYLYERGPADVLPALALIHHFAISNNSPLDNVAGFFARFFETRDSVRLRGSERTMYLMEKMKKAVQ